MPSIRRTQFAAIRLQSLRTAYLILICGCMAASSVHAQNPYEWITTQWSVGCDKDLEDHFSDSYQAGLDDDLDGDAAGENARALCDRWGNNREFLIAAVEDQLEETSNWLRDLDFRAPVVNKAENPDAPNDLHYNATVSANPAHFEPPGRCGGYCRNVQNEICTPKMLFVRWDCMFEMFETREEDEEEERRTGDNTFSPTHELFHAIQRNYMPEHVMYQKSHAWITEGMADAVELTWKIKSEPKSQPRTTPRHYDRILHAQPGEGDPVAYRTRDFWLFVGRQIGSTDSIQYLQNVLKTDLSDASGLSGVDQIIKRQRWHEEGLAHFYPEFIKVVAITDAYFKNITQIKLEYRENDMVEQKLEEEVVDAVASNAYRVVVDAPADRTLYLTIEIDVDDPDLHLVVDDARYDGPGTVRRNFVLKEITGPDTFFVRVANVAPNAAETGMNGFSMTIKLFEEYASMGHGEGSVTPGDIAAPLPFVLDAIEHAMVLPGGLPVHAEMGLRDVCLFQFHAENEAAGNSLLFRLDLLGPLVPGAYPIERDGHPAHAEDFIGSAGAVFALGPDRNHGIRMPAYHGQSGILTIEKASPDFIEGYIWIEGRVPDVAMTTPTDPTTDRIGTGPACSRGGGMEKQTRTVMGREITLNVLADSELVDCPVGLQNTLVQAQFGVIPHLSPLKGADEVLVEHADVSIAECFANESPDPRPPRPRRQGSPSADPPGTDPISKPPTPPPPPPPAAEDGPDIPVLSGSPGSDGGAAPGTEPGFTTGSVAWAYLDEEGGPQGTANFVEVVTTGDVETRTAIPGQSLQLEGGCDDTYRLSVELLKGSPQDPDWFQLAVFSMDPIGIGETGTVALKEVRWDNGSSPMPNMPAGMNIRTPNQYSGNGSLELSTHNATAESGRMIGTVRASVRSNGLDQDVELEARIDINVSCGVRQ